MVSAVALAALALIASTPSAELALDPDVRQLSLAGPWRFLVAAPTPDRGPADPGAADASWETFEVPGLFRPGQPVGGVVWMRRRIAVPWFDGSPEALARWARHQPSVAVIGEVGNAWELYAGGEKVGGFGDVPSDDDAPRLLLPAPVVVPLPASSVRDGVIVLALRVWRDPHLPKLDPSYSGVSGVRGDIVVGRATELQAVAGHVRAQVIAAELAFGPILAVLLLVGFYHLQLFRRRPALREYLWLGLLLIVLGVIGTLHSFWWDPVTINLGLRVKASVAGGFIVGPLFIAFLRPVLGRTVGRGWRAYIVVQLVFGAATALVPGTAFFVATTAPRAALWLPWIFMSVGLVVVEAKRNNPEARTMLAGLGVFAAAMVYNLMQGLGVVGAVGIDNGMLVLLLGATAFVLSMAVSLSNRFVRVYTDLDGLHRDLDQTYRAAARFVPIEFMRLIGRASVREVKIGDQVALPMSILFCDVRGFTTLAEALGPDQTFALINSYLRAMEPAIHGHNGFIRQYLGDGIMALFPGAAEDAVAAAVDMQRALTAFNVGRSAPLAIGIGINTGPVMLGTIGGTDRLDSGVVGDAVNLASRIEGMTKTYGATVLLGEATVAALPAAAPFRLRAIDRVVAKGRSEPLVVTEVEDVLDDDARARRAHTAARFAAGQTALRAGAFAEAEAAFADVVAADPSDGPAQVLRERAGQFAKAPPPDWRGATRLLTK